MPKEFEHQFYNVNKKDVISKIKAMKGKHKGTYLFRVQVLLHPHNAPDTYIRVRDEGYRTTMTYKHHGSKDKFSDEEEVIIDNFDSGVNILLGLGCKKKYYYEKIREIWYIKNTEVIFDSNPGIIDKMEVESKTLKELKEMVKYFDLKIEERSDMYMDTFGIIIPKTIDLTFANVKKELTKLVKKNKDVFIKLVDNQMKKYKKLIKKD
jgi:adenylate cyclase class IV